MDGFRERSSRVTPNSTQTLTVVEPVIVSIVVVANVELMDGNIIVSHDVICPLSQMIPEDPILFDGTMYERELAENYVRLSITKVLPRRSRI